MRAIRACLAWGQGLLPRWLYKRGVVKGVVDPQAAINSFVVDQNQQPKPFVWATDPDKIIAAAARGHKVLDSIHSRIAANSLLSLYNFG